MVKKGSEWEGIWIRAFCSAQKSRFTSTSYSHWLFFFVYNLYVLTYTSLYNNLDLDFLYPETSYTMANNTSSAPAGNGNSVNTSIFGCASTAF